MVIKNYVASARVFVITPGFCRSSSVPETKMVNMVFASWLLVSWWGDDKEAIMNLLTISNCLKWLVNGWFVVVLSYPPRHEVPPCSLTKCTWAELATVAAPSTTLNFQCILAEMEKFWDGHQTGSDKRQQVSEGISDDRLWWWSLF